MEVRQLQNSGNLITWTPSVFDVKYSSDGVTRKKSWSVRNTTKWTPALTLTFNKP